MRSIFESLYYGDYSVFEQHVTAALMEKEAACNPFYDKVKEQFGREFLDNMLSASDDAAKAELLSIYAAGIRFGGRFMLELLSDADT